MRVESHLETCMRFGALGSLCTCESVQECIVVSDMMHMQWDDRDRPYHYHTGCSSLHHLILISNAHTCRFPRTPSKVCLCANEVAVRVHVDGRAIGRTDGRESEGECEGERQRAKILV
jgi:hypothetical protein